MVPRDARMSKQAGWAAQAFGAASRDHLAELFLLGDGPSGSYTPFGFELRGSGREVGLDRMSHLHEALHAVLNDATSWGGALHLLARLGPARVFRARLDQCREVHESFATLGSVLLIETHHAEVRSWLAERYPAYARLLSSAEPLVSCCHGPLRQYLLLSQLARVCLQTPILTSVPNEGFAFESPPALDVPDRRWAWLLRNAGELVADAARRADAAARSCPDGDVALARDTFAGADPADIPAFDEAWTAWEITAYDRIASALRAVGANVLDFDGHQEAIAQAIAWAGRQGTHPGLAVPDEQIGMGEAFQSAAVAQARLVVADTGTWRARWLSPDAVLQPMALHGDALLVLDARPATRLRELFIWELGGPTGDSPVVAVRTIEIEADQPVIEHLELATPGDAALLLDRWGELRRPLSCVSASCLLDRPWADDWVPLLLARTTLFVLIDVDPGQLLPVWGKGGGSASRLQVVDPSGTWECLLIASTPEAPRWLLIADELGIGIVQQGLRDDGRVAIAPPDEAPADTLELEAILTHLLATESFFDLGGSRPQPTTKIGVPS